MTEPSDEPQESSAALSEPKAAIRTDHLALVVAIVALLISGAQTWVSQRELSLAQQSARDARQEALALRRVELCATASEASLALTDFADGDAIRERGQEVRELSASERSARELSRSEFNRAYSQLLLIGPTQLAESATTLRERVELLPLYGHAIAVSPNRLRDGWSDGYATVNTEPSVLLREADDAREQFDAACRNAISVFRD